jgi:hypothetical protein
VPVQPVLPGADRYLPENPAELLDLGGGHLVRCFHAK